jgi:outer membrane protein OmpA-like peptidoglycan-associated protein
MASIAFLAACAPQIGVYHISFDSNSFNIDGTGQRTIYAVADAVKASSAASVTIVGWADAAGSPDYNLQLSKKRALAVHDALIATGEIVPDQIGTSWTSERLKVGEAASTTSTPGSRVVDIFVH